MEDGVDWTPLCERGATVLLIGPEAVVPRDPNAAGNACVSVLKELYSVKQHGDGDAAADLVLLLNADLYTCVWRRTLVELLQSGLPAVATFYCEFEGR